MSQTIRRPFYLAGEKHSSEDYWEITQPGTSEPFALAAKSKPEHLESAISKAVDAEKLTRKLSTFERVRILQRAADAVEKESDRLAEDLAREAGKPISLARGEVGRAVLTLRTSAEEASRLGGEVPNLDVTSDSENIVAYSRRVPIGAISAITPFNFPLNLVAHKLGPAVAAGCPIVIKPSENTPLSALNLAQIVLNSGWPKEALSVVTVPVEDAAPLVEDERLKMITFTGSAQVGWGIKNRAGKKRVALELGGSAAVIVDEDANLETAAKRCAAGALAYAGQSCISVQRIFVHWQVKKQFLRLLMEEIAMIKSGDIFNPDVLIGPLINEKAAEKVQSWVEEAISQGAHLLVGGKRDGLFYSPTLLTQVQPSMKVCCEEIFGPVAVVDSFNSWSEVLAKVNATNFGLQAGLFSNNFEHIMRAIEELNFGAVLVNEIPTFRVDPQPYGGVKDSGFGKEGPKYAIREMTEEKLVMIRK
jgi:acyl-CoA reductase-like NAD-dependent aldehyde dehydrogenase